MGLLELCKSNKIILNVLALEVSSCNKVNVFKPSFVIKTLYLFVSLFFSRVCTFIIVFRHCAHSLQVNVLWMISKKNIYNANVINVFLAGSKKQYFSALNREQPLDMRHTLLLKHCKYYSVLQDKLQQKLFSAACEVN